MLFNELSKDADLEWCFVDASIVRAHQHSTGAATSDTECIGKSAGGNTTKIHLLVDSGALPVYFKLSEGKQHDITHAKSLVEHLKAVNLFIADKGAALRQSVTDKGGETVIAKRNYGQNIDRNTMDWCPYKYRHLVENAFARIKHYRSISYDKLSRNYAGMLSLAFLMMWLPMHAER